MPDLTAGHWVGCKAERGSEQFAGRAVPLLGSSSVAFRELALGLALAPGHWPGSLGAWAALHVRVLACACRVEWGLPVHVVSSSTQTLKRSNVRWAKLCPV